MFTIPSVGVILEVIIRTVIVFFFTYFIMRLRGVKQLMQMNIFDIIIIIALGSAVGDAMIYGEEVVPLLVSLTAIATLVLLIYGVESLLAIAPTRIVRLVEGEEVLLIQNGKIIKDNLKRVNLNEEELKSKLRTKNIHSISKVRKALLEPDGSISVKRKRNNKK